MNCQLKIMINYISFDSGSKDFILNAFGKTTDNEEYIVEKNTNLRVITPDGQEVMKKDFGGIRYGSEIYFKSDLPSLIKLCDDLSN